MRYAAVNPLGDYAQSGFRVMVLGYFSRESRRVRLAREWEKSPQKKKKNWYMRLGDFDVPNTIQPVMVWRAVMQMIPCTTTLVCFVP